MNFFTFSKTKKMEKSLITRTTCAVKESETDWNIEKQITYFVICSFLAMFLRSQWYDFDAIAHAGAPFGIEWLQNSIKIVWTVFEEKGRRKKVRLHK